MQESSSKKSKKKKNKSLSQSDDGISTLSIAISGSILENAQSAELRTYLAGQVARAACIFKVDEIIVFDDQGVKDATTSKGFVETDDGQTVRKSCAQFVKILNYLECPQYLRKFFFPLHKDLQYSGLLNPLDSQHHLRQHSSFIYREGATTDKKPKDGANYSFVNVGLLNEVRVDQRLEENLRVTVRLEPGQDLRAKKIRGHIVSPTEPRRETGIYWGYNVRLAKSLSAVFTQSPYADGYDLTIGTSDKGDPVNGVEKESLTFQHALIVFGGLQGLEAALENDDKLNLDDPELLFDHYLNTAPAQGSRTIRTEEAILISLSALGEKLKPKNPAKQFRYSDEIAQSEDTGSKASKKLKLEKS